MLFYSKLKDENTHEYEVINQIKAEALGWEQHDLEVGFDGKLYAAGFAPVKPLEKLAAEKRAERDAAIEQVIWRVQRYDQQKSLQILTTDTEETYQNLLQYIQSLRDISKDPDFPNVDVLSFEEWETTKEETIESIFEK